MEKGILVFCTLLIIALECIVYFFPIILSITCVGLLVWFLSLLIPKKKGKRRNV